MPWRGIVTTVGVIQFSPNFGIDIELPPEYEHSHEFPADPQAFWDAMQMLQRNYPPPFSARRSGRGS
jgi:hypothetical protein